MFLHIVLHLFVYLKLVEMCKSFGLSPKLIIDLEFPADWW